MRSLLASATLVGSMSIAAADPARCKVDVSRAPDEVRAAIAQWVEAEPRCATSLDVRVVATDGGYYVIAHGNGRVFERVVPDAQAVGVLVASWAADDQVAPPPPAAPVVEPELPLRPPGTIAPTVVVDRATVPVKPPQPQRWLALGAMAQVEGAASAATGSRGVRADLDIFRRGKLSLGAGLALLQTDLVMYGSTAQWNYISTDDVRLQVGGAYTHRMGAWALRASGAIGLNYTSGSGTFDSMPVEGHGVFPSVEAAFLVARDLTARWGVFAGPVLTAYHQKFIYANGSGSTISAERGTDLSLYGGILRRL